MSATIPSTRLIRGACPYCPRDINGGSGFLIRARGFQARRLALCICSGIGAIVPMPPFKRCEEQRQITLTGGKERRAIGSTGLTLTVARGPMRVARQATTPHRMIHGSESTPRLHSTMIPARRVCLMMRHHSWERGIMSRLTQAGGGMGGMTFFHITGTRSTILQA